MRHAWRVAVLGFLSLAAPLWGQEAFWFTDIHAAYQTARAQNKPVLIYFTGSDWCPWCIRLDKQVLNTPTFAQASTNWILLKADFPRTTPINAELQRQNMRLATLFGVEGFPVLILTDGQGNELGRMGYAAVGPEIYIRHIQSLLP
jgi:protein disulfide-isomerase